MATTLIANRYAVRRQLGVGGQGEVYEVVDTHEGDVVALKLLTLVGAGGPWVEAQILRRLSDPHILPIRNADVASGRPYVVTELAVHGALDGVLATVGPCGLDVDDAVRLVRQACHGVARGHDLRLLHNDIKPANLFLNGQGECVVGDFGFASRHRGRPSPALQRWSGLTGRGPSCTRRHWRLACVGVALELDEHGGHPGAGGGRPYRYRCRSRADPSSDTTRSPVGANRFRCAVRRGGLEPRAFALVRRPGSRSRGCAGSRARHRRERLHLAQRPPRWRAARSPFDENNAPGVPGWSPAGLDGGRPARGHAAPVRRIDQGQLFVRVRDAVGAEEASALLSMSHSCSKPGAQYLGAGFSPADQCGLCYSCLVRRAAFVAADVDDRTEYVIDKLAGDHRRAGWLTDDKRSHWTSVQSAASRGLRAADILALGLPSRFDRREALSIAQAGLDELAALDLDLA